MRLGVGGLRAAALILLGISALAPLPIARAEEANLALAEDAGVSGAEDADAPPGSIEFVGRNLLLTANGAFHRWRFTRVEIDRAHPERSVVEVEIDVASIDTGIERRDEHLRTADFFEVEKWPTATVHVTGASPDGASATGNPRYRANFRIRIRDVEKTLPGSFEVVAEDPPQVAGDLVLNRIDFGVGEPHRRWNPTSIREEIPVHFSVRIPQD
jgi:polyisoprenoid-binding protein YceI